MEGLRKSQYKHFIEFASLEGKKIIEVGCGRGEFLGMLSDFPVEGYGTEHKKGSCTDCKKKQDSEWMRISRRVKSYI